MRRCSKFRELTGRRGGGSSEFFFVSPTGGLIGPFVGSINPSHISDYGYSVAIGSILLRGWSSPKELIAKLTDNKSEVSCLRGQRIAEWNPSRLQLTYRRELIKRERAAFRRAGRYERRSLRGGDSACVFAGKSDIASLLCARWEGTDFSCAYEIHSLREIIDPLPYAEFVLVYDFPHLAWSVSFPGGRLRPEILLVRIQRALIPRMPRNSGGGNGGGSPRRFCSQFAVRNDVSICVAVLIYITNAPFRPIPVLLIQSIWAID